MGVRVPPPPLLSEKCKEKRSAILRDCRPFLFCHPARLPSHPGHPVAPPKRQNDDDRLHSTAPSLDGPGVSSSPTERRRRCGGGKSRLKEPRERLIGRRGVYR